MDNPLPIPEVKKPTPKVEPIAHEAIPSGAPVNTYVDPFTAMYSGTNPDTAALAVRGEFSARFFASLLQAHTAKVLEDDTTPQVSEQKMRILAKQAVWGADLVLAELASTNNRRV